jgi:K+-transporting ATPase ATPase C chain
MNATRRLPISLTFLLLMTILTGVLYPALVTGLAQVAFPAKANGSVLTREGKVWGSALLSQKFESPRYFRARPSASDYAHVGAGASNLGPVSADLAKAVAERRAAWVKDFGGAPEAVPEDMLYASASGLDPDISLEAALAQAPRVAAARAGAGSPEAAELESLLTARARKMAGDATSLIGPPRVNVVSLNAWLDTLPGASK